MNELMSKFKLTALTALVLRSNLQRSSQSKKLKEYIEFSGASFITHKKEFLLLSLDLHKRHCYLIRTAVVVVCSKGLVMHARSCAEC